MPRLDEWQLQRKELVDAIRTAAGFHFRAEKRRVLNEVENDLLAEFDKRLAAGESFQLEPGDVLRHVRKALTGGT